MAIYIEKGKTPLLNVQLQEQKHQKRLTKGMVILSEYELVLNPAKGVFGKESGAEYLSML